MIKKRLYSWILKNLVENKSGLHEAVRNTKKQKQTKQFKHMQKI